MSQIISSNPLYNTVLTPLLYTSLLALFMASSNIPALLPNKTNILPYSTYIQTLLLHYISETILLLYHILSCNTPYIQNILQNILYLLYIIISPLHSIYMHSNLSPSLPLFCNHILIHLTSVNYLFFPLFLPSSFFLFFLFLIFISFFFK